MLSSLCGKLESEYRRLYALPQNTREPSRPRIWDTDENNVRMILCSMKILQVLQHFQTQKTFQFIIPSKSKKPHVVSENHSKIDISCHRGQNLSAS